MQRKSVMLISTLALALACSETAGQGELHVLVEAEDVIIEGLAAGAGSEDVQDGWAVDFETYAVAIGDIEVQLSTDASVTAGDAKIVIIDLAQVSAAGETLWMIPQLEQGSWEFRYAVATADADATAHASVEPADYDAMVAEGSTYLVRGTLSKADGHSCPPASLAIPGSAVADGQNAAGDPCYPAASVRFELGAAAATRFGPCEVDGMPGFSITAGGQTSVAMTIHGDHLFFNGFPEGDEGGVVRLAQWLADCDLDLDGTVTRAELESISPADLVEIDERFQLGGSPLTPLDDMFTYVVAQLMTQGHFQGEGECPISG